MLRQAPNGRRACRGLGAGDWLVVLCGRERARELIACEHQPPPPPAGVPQLRKRLPYTRAGPGPAAAHT